jgi:hypothetical protein
MKQNKGLYTIQNKKGRSGIYICIYTYIQTDIHTNTHERTKLKKNCKVIVLAKTLNKIFLRTLKKAENVQIVPKQASSRNPTFGVKIRILLVP